MTARFAPYSYRSDAAVPPFADDKPVIVFDGFCVFCSAWARFVMRFDRKQVFRLLAAQSELGRALYVHYGLDPENYETNIVLMDGVPWFKSEAAIRAAGALGFPWSLARVVRVLPLAWRDALYDVVARNRFRIMGRRDVCFAPDAKDRARFLA
jgi:predicted DCC family thiol-disulfide oxidoreductase YuxK